jgi:GNAT superfamily N-acetyltransferase
VARFAPFEPDPPQRSPHLHATIELACADDVAAIAELVAEREGGDAMTLAQSLAPTIAPSPTRAVFVARINDSERCVAFGRVAWVDVPPDLVDGAPTGWYLQGVVVGPEWRRRGIGRALVEARLAWLAGRGDACFYVANAANRASIALHDAFDFALHRERFVLPGVTFDGRGVLFRRAM